MRTRKLTALFAAGLLAVSALGACSTDDDTDTDIGDDGGSDTTVMIDETTTTVAG